MLRRTKKANSKQFQHEWLRDNNDTLQDYAARGVYVIDTPDNDEMALDGPLEEENPDADVVMKADADDSGNTTHRVCFILNHVTMGAIRGMDGDTWKDFMHAMTWCHHYMLIDRFDPCVTPKDLGNAFEEFLNDDAIDSHRIASFMPPEELAIQATLRLDKERRERVGALIHSVGLDWITLPLSWIYWPLYLVEDKETLDDLHKGEHQVITSSSLALLEELLVPPNTEGSLPKGNNFIIPLALLECTWHCQVRVVDSSNSNKTTPLSFQQAETVCQLNDIILQGLNTDPPSGPLAARTGSDVKAIVGKWRDTALQPPLQDRVVVSGPRIEEYDKLNPDKQHVLYKHASDYSYIDKAHLGPTAEVRRMEFIRWTQALGSLESVKEQPCLFLVNNGIYDGSATDKDITVDQIGFIPSKYTLRRSHYPVLCSYDDILWDRERNWLGIELIQMPLTVSMEPFVERRVSETVTQQNGVRFVQLLLERQAMQAVSIDDMSKRITETLQKRWPTLYDEVKVHCSLLHQESTLERPRLPDNGVPRRGTFIDICLAKRKRLRPIVEIQTKDDDPESDDIVQEFDRVLETDDDTSLGGFIVSDEDSEETLEGDQMDEQPDTNENRIAMYLDGILLEHQTQDTSAEMRRLVETGLLRALNEMVRTPTDTAEYLYQEDAMNDRLQMLQDIVPSATVVQWYRDLSELYHNSNLIHFLHVDILSNSQEIFAHRDTSMAFDDLVTILQKAQTLGSTSKPLGWLQTAELTREWQVKWAELTRAATTHNDLLREPEVVAGGIDRKVLTWELEAPLTADDMVPSNAGPYGLYFRLLVAAGTVGALNEVLLTYLGDTVVRGYAENTLERTFATLQEQTAAAGLDVDERVQLLFNCLAEDSLQWEDMNKQSATPYYRQPCVICGRKRIVNSNVSDATQDKEGLIIENGVLCQSAVVFFDQTPHWAPDDPASLAEYNSEVDSKLRVIYPVDYDTEESQYARRASSLWLQNALDATSEDTTAEADYGVAALATPEDDLREDAEKGEYLTYWSKDCLKCGKQLLTLRDPRLYPQTNERKLQRYYEGIIYRLKQRMLGTSVPLLALMDPEFASSRALRKLGQAMLIRHSVHFKDSFFDDYFRWAKAFLTEDATGYGIKAEREHEDNVAMRLAHLKVPVVASTLPRRHGHALHADRFPEVLQSYFKVDTEINDTGVEVDLIPEVIKALREDLGTDGYAEIMMRPLAWLLWKLERLNFGIILNHYIAKRVLGWSATPHQKDKWATSENYKHMSLGALRDIGALLSAARKTVMRFISASGLSMADLEHGIKIIVSQEFHMYLRRMPRSAVAREAEQQERDRFLAMQLYYAIDIWDDLPICGRNYVSERQCRGTGSRVDADTTAARMARLKSIPEYTADVKQAATHKAVVAHKAALDAEPAFIMKAAEQARLLNYVIASVPRLKRRDQDGGTGTANPLQVAENWNQAFSFLRASLVGTLRPLGWDQVASQVNHMHFPGPPYFPTSQEPKYKWGSDLRTGTDKGQLGMKIVQLETEQKTQKAHLKQLKKTDEREATKRQLRAIEKDLILVRDKLRQLPLVEWLIAAWGKVVQLLLCEILTRWPKKQQWTQTDKMKYSDLEEKEIARRLLPFRAWLPLHRARLINMTKMIFGSPDKDGKSARVGVTLLSLGKPERLSHVRLIVEKNTLYLRLCAPLDSTRYDLWANNLSKRCDLLAFTKPFTSKKLELVPADLHQAKANVSQIQLLQFGLGTSEVLKAQVAPYGQSVSDMVANVERAMGADNAAEGTREAEPNSSEAESLPPSPKRRRLEVKEETDEPEPFYSGSGDGVDTIVLEE